MTDTNERMSEEQVECLLCGGTEEVEIVPHSSIQTLGRAGTYGCPACIERKLRTDLAAAKERAERAEERSWPRWRRVCDTSNGEEHWKLHDLDGRCVADVWGGTWHTWDRDGNGGENDVDADSVIARQNAVAALERQGWAPPCIDTLRSQLGEAREAGWKVVQKMARLLERESESSDGEKIRLRQDAHRAVDTLRDTLSRLAKADDNQSKLDRDERGEMPKVEEIFHQDDIMYYGWEVTYGTTAIERFAAEKAAKAERLREALELVRAKAIHHDPEYTGMRTNGSMPRWNGVVAKIDAALTKETTDGIS